ncbi:MAG TPA: hypothetical protein VK442_01475 [Xanthobacteraceae bacterium]|nr:hypothetical protein [Xanthobacteraceae bacterium]
MTRTLPCERTLAIALLLASLASAAFADDLKLVTENYMIPSADPGIQLYIRNKHPVGVTTFPGDKILLYVHGATYPSETAFDLPLGGRSMMDYVASKAGTSIWSMCEATAARRGRRKWIARRRRASLSPIPSPP